MKFDKQIKAKELRKQGKAVTAIAKELGVAKSSVSVWVQDIQLTPKQKEKLLESQYGNFKDKFGEEKHLKALEIRKAYQEEGRIKAQNEDLLYCIGCMLFWAEGTKNKNTITFTNSDVNMMKIFSKFLKEKLLIPNDKISMHINCFVNKHEEIGAVRDYWINELNIHGCNLRKPTIKLTDNQVENYGICSLTINNTQLAQQLYGAIQEYGGFNNNLCLNNKRTRK